MIEKRLFILALCFSMILKTIGQPSGYEAFGKIYDSKDANIELWIKKPKITCGNNSKSFKYILIPRNINKNIFNNNSFISWRMDILNCEGNNYSYFFSVDISEFLNYGDPDQHWEKMDWEFVVDSITSPIYDLNQTSMELNEKNKFIEKLDPPLGISGPSIVLKSDIIKLSLTGGNLSGSSKWFWYKHDCENGVFIGNGSEIKDLITQKTTYYARAEENKRSSVCVSFTVDIDSIGIAPSKIQVDNGEILCDDMIQHKTLKITDGRLAADAEWVWYVDEIKPENKRAANTTEIKVLPKKTTKYIVRAENKNTQYSKSVTIILQVINKSIQPTSIESNAKNGFICEGTSLMLIAKGGTLSQGAKYTWESIDENGIVKQLGTGDRITTKPKKKEVYSVKIVGLCEVKSKPISIEIDLHKLTVKPNESDIQVKLNRSKTSYLISIPENKGYLGTNAKWLWYSDVNVNKKIGNGNVIKTKSDEDKMIYVRGEGLCNNSELISKYLKGIKTKKFLIFNLGIQTNNFSFDTSRMSNFVLTLGTNKFYIKSSFGIPISYESNTKDIEKSSLVYDGNSIVNFSSNTGTYYQFNNKYYSDLNTYIIGIMAGKKALKFTFGAGYGSYKLLWGVNIYDYSTNNIVNQNWAQYDIKNITGPSLENGLFLKIGIINLTTNINGIYSIKTKKHHLSGQIGIGLNIKY